MSPFQVALLLTLLVQASGSPQAPAAARWPTYPVSSAPAELRTAIRRGDVILTPLQSAFTTGVTRAMDEAGPVGALRSCHLDASAAAYRAAREQNIAAGLTSARLRTPTNRPRAWAEPVVAQYTGRAATGVDGFVVDLGDRVGLLRPLVQRPICSPCHGTEDQLDARVRSELRDRYPSDRAVGFRAGEIRGWLWVEVPKQ
jgi:hypothetical protein